MNDSAATANSAKPERFFILGTDGRVAYAGARGPHGVDIDALEARLVDVEVRGEFASRSVD